MTRQQVVAFGLFGVLLVLLYQLAETFSLFVKPVLWAVILAHVTFPLRTWLPGLLRGREVAAAVLWAVEVVVLIIALVVVFTFLVGEEAWNSDDAVNSG